MQAMSTALIDDIARTAGDTRPRTRPTCVRSIDTTTLADQNRVIVTFLNGMIQEYTIDDPIFHYLNFQICRRRAHCLRRHTNDRRAS